MSPETITHTPPIANDDGFEPEPGTLFSPEEMAHRAAEFARLVTEAGPVVNIFGEPIPTLTLADELVEVDEAVEDGVCSKSWARSARQTVLDRHRVEPTPPADDDAPDSEPVRRERATETTGADPPAVSYDPFVDFDNIPGALDTVAYLVSAQVRRGTPLSPTVTPGLVQVECPARCCWYVFDTLSGVCVFTGASREQAEQAAARWPKSARHAPTWTTRRGIATSALSCASSTRRLPD